MSVVYTTPFYVAGGSWNSVYNAQIMPTGLTPLQQKNILGAQVCAWGEHMGSSNLNTFVWQTGAAAAESFWDPAHPTVPGVGSAAGLATGDRYNRFLCHLRRFGVGVPEVMPSYCGVPAP